MKLNTQKFDWSIYTMIALLLVLTWIVFSHIPHKILSWDIFGYYLYLPFTFIYYDLGLRDFAVVQGIIDKYQNTAWFYQALPQQGGEWVMKYPMGMAVLYLPWFAVGHLWAIIGGYETDGFSSPYQLSVLYGSFIYTVLGIVFFRKSLRKFFDPLITSILLITIVFGTNYLVLTVYHGQGLMSHNYLFFLFALILWFTIRWHEQPSLKFATALGLLIGLAALSRPTEILVAGIPLFWGIHNTESLLNKVSLFKKRWKDVVILGLLITLIGGMQLVYFKLMTGKFLFNSYGGNAGEGMEFLHPYIWQVLFSFRKGWLIYTPVMILALAGFVQLFQRKREYFWSIFLFFIVSFYVIASWSCWWYADSFSQRALIPMYVFLAIPMGYLIEGFLHRNIILKILISALLIVLITFNLFQSHQFLKGIIHSSRMTKAYYKEVFLSMKLPADAEKLLLVDRNKSPEQLLASGGFTKRNIVVQMFENEGVDASAFGLKDARGKVVELSPKVQFSPKFETDYHSLGIEEYGILKITARVFVAESPEVNPFSITATFMHNGFAYYYKSKKADPNEIKLNQWNEMELLYLIPEVRRPDDNFRVTIWHRGEKPVYVDEVVIDLLQPER
ncbi:MAG: hypothetical protein FD155_1019 [Bacteroidetes bacterium]|nr:MAG: hypothetical protein FD155_1019 [Bacteroidota bacterium]